MTLSLDLALLPEGVSLAYLRGPNRGRWEALVRLPVPCDARTIAFAIGFGCDHNPATALSLALDALDRDPQLVTEALAQPTCTSTLASALANLLPKAAMPMSPPKFKLKA